MVRGKGTSEDNPVSPDINPIRNSKRLEVEDDGVEVDVDKEEEEAETARVPDVKKPSRDEIEKHNETHAQ